MREFLKGLDFDDDTIDAIMAEHGKLIGKEKEAHQKTKDKLAELQGKGDDVDKKIEEAVKAERKNFEIKMELKDKVHNIDITMGQLDLEKVVMDENGKIKSGLKEQIDALKKSDGYLFKTEANTNNGNNQNNAAFIKGATPKEGEGAQPTNLSAGELFATKLAQGRNEAIKNSADSIYFGE